MYKEPRSLAIAQRALSWVWELTHPLLGSRREDPLAADMAATSSAACVLEISEFELFRRAFRAWHGCAPNTRELEREFGRYLNQQAGLPFYVRRYLLRITVLPA